MDVLILGIGNMILTDDGVGIKTARRIKEENPNLEITEASEGGIGLLDYASGYDKLIIIDSIKTEQGKPGEVYKIEFEDLKPIIQFLHGQDGKTWLDSLFLQLQANHA